MVISHLVGRSGGAERIFVELANMLAERGYSVTCVTFDEEDGEPFYPLSPEVDLIALAPRHRRSHRFPLKWLTSKRFPRSVRQAADWHLKKDPIVRAVRGYLRRARPDVAISFLPPANTPTLLAAKGTRTRVVPTNHNVPERDYRDPKRWSSNPHDRKLRLSALRYAKFVHVIFPEFGEWFPASLQDRIVVVPNYVSNRVLRHQPQEKRDKIILAVGRVSKVKNYLTLVEAWGRIAKKHTDWRVLIYGNGPQGRRVRRRIAALGLQDSVELGGHHTDLGEVYARSAIFCHPAHFEGFGLAPAEALALKVPVVAFADCAGVNQFVKDGVNGLMVQRNEGAEGLAAALEKLILDPDLRNRLGDRGPESVAAFTEQKYVEAWVHIIERSMRDG